MNIDSNKIATKIEKGILSEEAYLEYIKSRILDELDEEGVFDDIASIVVKKLEKRGVKVNEGWV